MPDRQEVLSSIYGAYRLARFDPKGLTFFNVSVEGFWHSFFAAVLVAPGYVILVGQGLLGAPDGYAPWAFMVHVASYLISWIIFPLVALVVTDMLKLGHRFTAVIVAVNWSAVIEVGVFLLAITLATILPAGPGGMIILAVTIGIIVYQWFVIRTALQTTGAIALALVLFNLVTNLMLEKLTERLL